MAFLHQIAVQVAKAGIGSGVLAYPEPVESFSVHLHAAGVEPCNYSKYIDVAENYK